MNRGMEIMELRSHASAHVLLWVGRGLCGGGSRKSKSAFAFAHIRQVQEAGVERFAKPTVSRSLRLTVRGDS